MAWKLVVHSGENRELALTALQKCLSFISEACNVVRAQDLAVDAYQIFMEERVAFYDSLFLALARREKAPLLTLDQKLCQKVRDETSVQLI